MPNQFNDNEANVANHYNQRNNKQKLLEKVFKDNFESHHMYFEITLPIEF